MKKIGIILLIFFATILLSACIKGYKDPCERAEEECDIILSAIKSDDAKTIEKLFCKYMKKNNPNLHDDIQRCIDYIDGNIVSVGRIRGRKGSWSSEYMKGLNKQEYDGEVKDIQTDTGQNYKLIIYGCNVDKERPDYVGIRGICIVDMKKLDETKDYSQSEIYIDDSLIDGNVKK